ncbi:DMT family transporter [Anaerolineae bacterium CFX9]|nr:DMT family transporter [Anaerolineae bacterium CFX9]
MSKGVRGAIYGLSAAAIWGGMYVVSDLVLEIIPPFTLVTIRLIMAAVVFALMLALQGRKQFPRGGELARIILVGIIGFGISIGAQFVGTDKSTAVNGALITSASPAFILLFAALILRERLTVARIGAVALATIGVIVIIDPSRVDLSSDTFVGNLALALAALTWGLYSVLIRQLSARYDTLTISFIVLFGGLLLTVPGGALELGDRPIGEITLPVILGVLYLGIVSTAGAMYFWNRAFALVDASVASLFFFAQPLVGAVLSVLVLGQELTENLIIGSLMIGVGVLIAMLSPSPDQKLAAASAAD